ncbi:hypothetical protein FPOAC1_007860 [Fusarium poae]|uniref:Uncharacterized protein n=1 Tax=Fusarium poae TaxID=36050 RepID=A0A1B8AJG3_FUSPO|nr:hypothetical protein FPOAC1_007860 [Fusarium poae]KAG8668479.1 hypothetical protein FPOAC1_007860 [Fusarium poae]OBS20723.1 hypothetical protein FPOA_07063 [Fusarium poae]
MIESMTFRPLICSTCFSETIAMNRPDSTYQTSNDGNGQSQMTLHETDQRAPWDSSKHAVSWDLSNRKFCPFGTVQLTLPTSREVIVKRQLG